MINRWQGNSGRVQRFPEQNDNPVNPRQVDPPIKNRPQSASAAKANTSSGLFSGLEGLKNLLPQKAAELETEDIILLLILYLMYRESGDSELLMIMGAMFLL